MSSVPINPAVKTADSMVDDRLRKANEIVHTILIVDDDDAIRDAIHEFLSRLGYVAHSASSAEEAMDLLHTTAMDVVITDIILPGKDGLELTDHVRRHYDSDVIVMTGYSGNYSYEEAINKGASDLVFKPVRFEELLLRLKRVLRERALARERDRIVSQLQMLAITDGLTHLYNSRHFYNQLEVEVKRCIRYAHPLALMLMDIDHFKHYNDTYGHLEGDKVLLHFGQVIQSCLRQMDSAYRYGGEEFTVILPETGADEASTVAYRIKDAIAVQRFYPQTNQGPVGLTISIGVAQYAPPEDLSTFVQRADQAMYASKKSGRNRVSTLSA